MGKRILAVIGGLMTAMIVITLCEMVSKAIYPLPPGFNEKVMNAWAELIKTMPAGALWFVILGYALGAFAGGMVASKVTGKMVSAIIVGVIVTLLCIANVLLIAHPMWFTIISILVGVPFAYLGGKLMVKTPAAA